MTDKPEIVVQCRCVKVNIPDPPTPEHIEAVRRTLLAGLPVYIPGGQAFRARRGRCLVLMDDDRRKDARRVYRSCAACARAIAPHVAPESLP